MEFVHIISAIWTKFEGIILSNKNVYKPKILLS